MTLDVVDCTDRPRFSNFAPVILLAMFVVFAGLVLRRSWVAEDAFITFRTVDNFVSGYGLTWNIGERVQAYTHPLWMFLNSAVYALTHEIFFSTLFLSLTLSILALVVFSKWLASSPIVAAFGVLALASSNAYVDYSTSGMENPLSHLLLAIFYALFFRLPPTTKKVFWLSLALAFVGLNRQDLLLLCLPAWLFALMEAPGRRKWVALLLGLLPYALWELFSLFYYGFLIPNTAFAKLNTGIPPDDLVHQGLSYLVSSLLTDPITLILIASGAGISFAFRNRKMMLCAVGIVLYLLYVVKIGGDFMSGRFLTAPLFCAVILVCLADYSSFPQGLTFLPFTLICLLNLASPLPTIELTSPRLPPELIDIRGVADERRFYEGVVGFSSINRITRYPLNYSLCMDGLYAKSEGLKVATHKNIGYLGFCAGPNVHIVDIFALADPLLSRLPIIPGPWRIGHFERNMPEGYLETLESGENRIADPHLSQYYEKLRLITSGALWDKDRLEAIWKMNTGQYDGWLSAYKDVNARRRLNEINEPKAVGTAWDAEGNIILSNGFVVIDLQQVYHAGQIEVSVDNNDTYDMVFMKKDKALKSTRLPAPLTNISGLRIDLVDVPPGVQERGFDKIKIVAVSGDGSYSIGHLRIIAP